MVQLVNVPQSKVLDDRGWPSRAWLQFFLNPQIQGVTLQTPLAVASGGTGINSYVIGDLIYASTTLNLSKLSDVATGNALISGGVGATPAWGKVGLTTHVSGTLPVANGGTGLPVYAVGDIVYADTTLSLARLPDVAAGSALISGGVGVAPSWGAYAAAAGTLTGTTLAAGVTTIGAPSLSVQALNTSAARSDTSYSYQTPATGFTITIGNSVYTLILDPAGALLTGTIIMCAAPVDGQVVRVTSTQNITTLTFSPNAGQSIKNAPTGFTVSLTGDQGYEFIYRAANLTWYRLQ